jgi:trimeric autotransporter adhesin
MINFTLKWLLLLLFITAGFSVAQAATFAISNGATFTDGTAASLTVSNTPNNTKTVTYFINGGSFATSNTSPYSFALTPSVGTYTEYAIAYNNAGVQLGITATITVTVYPAAPTVANVSSCGGGPVTITASGGSPAGGNYDWYAASTGGTPLQDSTLTTFTSIVNTTTTFYVTYVAGGMESTPRKAVTVTILAPPNLTTMPTTGAYLSYPFSGNATDISSNADNGTLQGGVTLTSDRFGNNNSAYAFNGSTGYISTGKQVAAPGPANFSISAWFRTSSAGGLIVGYTASQTAGTGLCDRAIYMTNTGVLFFGLYNSLLASYNTLFTPTGLNYADGTWHHVVATCSSTAGSTMYVDGVKMASSTSVNTGANTAGYWRIGYNSLTGWPGAPTNNYFNGSIDDVSIYTTTQTAAQVYVDYGAGSNPVACGGGTLSLQANSLTGASYSWVGPNGFTSTAQNPTVSTAATTAMAGVYTLTVTGSNGCTSTINVTAVLNTPTTGFTATSPSTTTGTSTVTYTGSVSATSSYSWNFGGGTIVSGVGAGPYVISWPSGGAKTITLTVTTLSGCSASGSQNLFVGPYGNYAFTDPVTLNTASLGISTNLTNFPALLSIQDNNLIIAGTCTDKVYFPNGPNYDFAFYDPAASTELNYQIESYNQTTGTLLVWVQIPTLTSSTNKSILFSYGSMAPTVTHNTAFYQKTWATDYQAVYHFSETTYTGTTTDGTANGNTGTMTGMTSSNLVTGKVMNAYSFNGSSSSIKTSGITNLTGNFTISAWVNMTVAGRDQKIMTNENSSGLSSGGVKLGIYSNNIPESEGGTALSRGATPTGTTLAASSWHYLQSIYNGSSLSTYIDGVQYAIVNTTQNPTQITPYYIGVGEGGNQYYFDGLIDEARVSNVAKTSDWIKAEYVDQNNPVSFTFVGATAVNTSNAAGVNGALTFTWSGGTSTDPSVAGNWNNTTTGTASQLPVFTGTATVKIPAGLSKYPVLTADASIYGLTLASGASINLNGHTLSVGCNIYNSSGGQILYGTNTASGLTWNGSAASQTYTGTNTANTMELANMTINNSSGGAITMSGGPIDIFNTLTLTNGDLIISASPAILTLKSTATLTASVAALPSGSTITGNVSAERYLVGGVNHRGYRLLSSPVYAATVSSNVYSINYLQTNTVITGFVGGGFDKTGNPSMYLFREDLVPSNASFISGNFWGFSAINNTPNYNYYLNGFTTKYNIPVGGGIMFFFRGNKASASLAAETVSTYIPVSVAVTATGTLNQGQVVARDWYTPTSQFLGFTGTGTGATTNAAVRGFNLVGNPYASSIDWETYNTSTTTTGIYAKNVGNTVYEFNDVTYNYDTYKVGGAHTNNGSNIIASGQGFYVLATNAANSQLIFNETAKTSAQNTGAGLFMALKPHNANSANSAATSQHLRIQLAKDSINTDDIYVGFDQSAKNEFVFDEDAAYHKGSGVVSLASKSADGVSLAINMLPLPAPGSTTIPLSISATADGVYNLNRTELQSIPPIYEVWLMDAYTKDSLDMRANTSYTFNLALADTNSYGSHRFSVVLRQNPALMVHLLSFAASKVTQGTQVLWKTENEANYTNFVVQRSIDGGHTFAAIGNLESNSLGTYTWMDNSPVVPSDGYRLQMTDLNGGITYSNVVTIMYGNNSGNNLQATRIGIYPNPCKSILNVSIVDPISTSTASGTTASKSYAIKIYNMAGIVIQDITSADTNWQTDETSLIPGTYIVKVFNNSNNNIIGQGTFIKL